MTRRLRVLRAAMAQVEGQWKELRESQKAAVREAVERGMSEAQTAREIGVSRLTVRDWIGKGPKRH